MKDYSEYLICSDFDGTLDWHGSIHPSNADAIRNFIDGGGRFTISTGRLGEELHSQVKLPFPINAPIAGSTGAQIYDYANEKVLEQTFLDNGWMTLVDDLIRGVNLKQTFEIVTPKFVKKFEATDERMRESVCREALESAVYKIVVYTDYTGADWLVPQAVEICQGRYNITSNRVASYEMTALGIDKGYAVRKIKEITGAKTLVCIGDYAGDLSMLQAADIAAAVDNAAPALKAVADRITVHAKDGALADLIANL